MRIQSKRRKKGSHGHVMLESALVLVTFFSMLIAVFDFGQFLFLHQTLVERTAWAARLGIAEQLTNTQIRNLVVYGTSDGSGSAYYNLTAAMVTVNSYDAGTDNARIEVKLINYPYTMFTPLIAGSYTGPNITMDVPVGMYD